MCHKCIISLSPLTHARTDRHMYIPSARLYVDVPHTYWNTRAVLTYVPKEHTDGIGKQKGVVQDAEFCLPFWSIYTQEQDTRHNEMTDD